MELKPSNLKFNRGTETFGANEFVDLISPYMADLQKWGRTKFLFVAQGGDKKIIGVTGYKTDTTINATINDKCLAAEKSGGRWAVYETIDSPTGT